MARRGGAAQPLAVVAVVVLLSACGLFGELDTASPGAAANTNKGSGLGWQGPDGCHTDCFGGRWCDGGKVIEMASEAIPCDSGKSCALSLVYTCAAGCNPHPPEKYHADPTRYCAEYPKNPGDRCNHDEECQPVNPPGGLLAGDVTLTCDSASRSCVSLGQPILADFKHSCGLPEDMFDDSKWPGNIGVANVAQCAAKTCLIAFSHPTPRSVNQASCMVQLCTKACETGWDCPQSARAWT